MRAQHPRQPPSHGSTAQIHALVLLWRENKPRGDGGRGCARPAHRWPIIRLL